MKSPSGCYWALNSGEDTSSSGWSMLSDDYERLMPLSGYSSRSRWNLSAIAYYS